MPKKVCLEDVFEFRLNIPKSQKAPTQLSTFRVQRGSVWVECNSDRVELSSDIVECSSDRVERYERSSDIVERSSDRVEHSLDRGWSITQIYIGCIVAQTG